MFIHKNYTFNRNKYNDKSKVNIEYQHGDSLLIFFNKNTILIYKIKLILQII
jgi:hypothetical protein